MACIGRSRRRALQVVQQRTLERLELAAVEVESGKHLGQIGVELSDALHKALELNEQGADLTGKGVRVGGNEDVIVVGVEGR